MAKPRRGGRISSIDDDIMQKILVRLPAESFAAAACVSKHWNRISSQILSRPKLATALSVNPSILEAVTEVVDKVLSKPIRPHFAIACISEQYALGLTHLLLSQRLGSKTPLVTHISNGVMGKDVLTAELREVQWDYFDYSFPHPRGIDYFFDSNQGIVLVVGYLPGLKVDAIPLFHPKTDCGVHIDPDEFVGKIKEYTAAVSSAEFPDAIMMFGDLNYDLNFITSKLDEAMPEETAIVGDAGGCFLFNSLNHAITAPQDSYILDAVALVFAKDKNKPIGVGETQFHVVKAAGLVPFGPTYETTGVGVDLLRKQSWLCASDRQHEPLTSDSILRILDEPTVQVVNQSANLYLAVNRERRNSIREKGRRIWKWTASTSLYHILRAEGPNFIAEGIGIRPGDSFSFYHRKLETAHTTSAAAFNTLRMLKEKTTHKEDDNDPNRDEDITSSVDNNGVFGGLIFSCKTRGASYFGIPNAETSPFSLNFPGVPFAGLFCKGEIGRGTSKVIKGLDRDEDMSPENCCLHSCSTVYLAMSYVPSEQ